MREAPLAEGEPSSASRPPVLDEKQPASEAVVASPPVEELENSEAAKKVKAKKIPPTVSAEGYQQHRLAHFPFRSWCTFCLKGKT